MKNKIFNFVANGYMYKSVCTNTLTKHVRNCNMILRYSESGRFLVWELRMFSFFLP